MHANAAGLVGGNAVCGSLEGDVAADEAFVTCPNCLRAIRQYYHDHHRADDDGMAQQQS